jgi:hypothetical protein
VSIGSYLKEGAFDPEVISAMAAVFDDVCKALDAAGRSDVAKDTSQPRSSTSHVLARPIRWCYTRWP